MTAFSQSLLQQLDANGAPLAGWSVRFFQSGTNTSVTVWKNIDCTSPHATPVRADGQGRLPVPYFKPDGVKLRAEITLPDGRVKVIDGIDPGTSSETASPDADPRLPSVSHTGLTVTLTKDDAGKMHAIPTALGAATAVLLPRAATLIDGQIIGLQNTGVGTVIYRTQGTDLLNGRKSLLLSEDGEVALVRCTGAGFERLSQTQKAPTRYVVVSNSVETPPVAPAAGTTYLAPSDATGDLWAPDTIYQSDGVGGWIKHAPVIGDEAVVTSKTSIVGSGEQIPLRLIYNGSAWVDQTQLARASVLHVRGEFASGTGSNSAYGLSGASPTVSVWTQVILNTTVLNSISGASISGNVVTLPKGNYRIRAKHKIKGAISARLRFVSTSTITELKGMSQAVLASTSGLIDVEGQISVTAATEAFQVMVYLSGTAAASTLGDAAAIAGESEVYGELFIAAV